MITKSDLEQKMQCLARFNIQPPDTTLHLSRYSPGDGKARYQIQAIDSNYCEQASWPRYGHWPTKDFAAYLDGMIEALWLREQQQQTKDS